MAEHAEAGASREPEDPDGRDPRGPGRATSRGRGPGGAIGGAPSRGASGAPAQRLRRPAPAPDARARPPGLVSRREGGEGAGGPRNHARGPGPRREPAAVHGPGLHGKHRHEPEALRDARLEPVRREGEPRRADPHARPGRRLRPDGLPEPRPVPARRGRARRADRRGAGARGPARRGKRAPGGGEEGDLGPDRARRLPPDRTRPAGARDRRGPSPDPSPACAAGSLRARDRALPRRDRLRDRARRPRRVHVREDVRQSRDGPPRGAPGAGPGERAGRSGRSAPRGRARSPEAAPAAGARRGSPPGRPDDGGRAHASRECRGRRAAPRAPRGAGPRQPRAQRPLRRPERLPRCADGQRERGRGDPRRRGRGNHGAQPPPRARHDGPLLPVPPGPPLEPAGRRLHGLGAKAREARGVQPPPAPPGRSRLPREGRRPLDPPVDPLRPHAGHRFAPAEGSCENADRHPLPPAQPAGGGPGGEAGDRGLRHPPAARQRHPLECGRLPVRKGLRRAHRRRPLLDGRLGHLPGPLRRRDLHREGPVRRGCLPRDRGRPRARERPPFPRPVRGPPRAHSARLRRRGRGRLPGQRPGARPTPAPLGARGLADPHLAPAGGKDGGRVREEPASAHQPVEDPRQPAPEPRGADAPRPLRGGLDDPAREPARLDPRRPRDRRLPARDVLLPAPRAIPVRDPRAHVRPRRHRGAERGGGPGVPDPRLPPVPRLGDAGRDRPDAGEARRHAAAAPGLGDGGVPGQACRGPAEVRRPLLLPRDGRESRRGRRPRRPHRGRTPSCWLFPSRPSGERRPGSRSG